MQVLAHNLASQFTNRQLNITTDKKAKSSEKLSSGYKINRSADDAAGLQISEKMRWQIRGLDQASENIQDGISLCQVADGALNESHAVLQRMRELSVQAANDTNSDEDRNAIQQEINQLTKEVDRIANDTNFNENIYPLKYHVSKSYVINDVNGIRWALPSILQNSTIQIGRMQDTVIDNTGISHQIQTTVDGKQLVYPGTTTINVIKYSDRDDICMAEWASKSNSQNSWNVVFGNTLHQRDSGDGRGSQYYADFSYISSVSSLTLNDLNVDQDGHIYINSNYDGRKYYLLDISMFNNNYGNLSATGFTSNNGTTWDFGNGDVRLNATKLDANATVDVNGYVNIVENQKLWIQMGAQKDQGMFLKLVNATAKGVGITDPALDVTDFNSASTSIARLDDAISKVSSYRSSFGAQQNRLEYGKQVDDNTAENTQKAESLIRDTDMAEEMVNYSKNNILEQAGQVLLAQANQSMQGILQLLK